MSDLDAICSGLEEKRDQLRHVADCADEAIAALRKLQAAYTGAAGLPEALPPTSRPAIARVAPPAAAAAATPAIDHHGHQVHGAARPRTAVCRNAPCGKEFAVKGTGRIPHYCSDVCRTASRRGGERPPAAEVDELLAPPEPIPESGGAMRDRIRRAAGRKGPTFLDRARERNDEAARRNGVRT